MECNDCNRPATHKQKDTISVYCGRHAGKWARKGLVMIELLQPKLDRARAAKAASS